MKDQQAQLQELAQYLQRAKGGEGCEFRPCFEIVRAPTENGYHTNYFVIPSENGDPAVGFFDPRNFYSTTLEHQAAVLKIITSFGFTPILPDVKS